MNKILKNKKVIIGITILIFGFIVYSVFFKTETSKNSGLVVGTAGNSNSQFIAGKEILALLSDLKSIQLNQDIFQNKTFRSLEDFSIPIEPEPQGRTNPFTAVGRDTVVAGEER